MMSIRETIATACTISCVLLAGGLLSATSAYGQEGEAAFHVSLTEEVAERMRSEEPMAWERLLRSIRITSRAERQAALVLFSGRLQEGEIAAEVASERFEAPSGRTFFPGDQFIPGDMFFPGDQFIPGDMFFPGDQFIPGDMFIPGDTFFPGDQFIPGDMFRETRAARQEFLRKVLEGREVDWREQQVLYFAAVPADEALREKAPGSVLLIFFSPAR